MTYDKEKYPFIEIIENWLEADDLSKLHEIKQYEHFERETDQSTIWHKEFYDMIRLDNSFDEIYMKFLKGVIKPRFHEEIV